MSTKRWLSLGENNDRIDDLIRICDGMDNSNPGWSRCSRLEEFEKKHHRYIIGDALIKMIANYLKYTTQFLSLLAIPFRFCAVSRMQSEDIYMFEEEVVENDPACYHCGI